MDWYLNEINTALFDLKRLGVHWVVAFNMYISVLNFIKIFLILHASRKMNVP